MTSKKSIITVVTILGLVLAAATAMAGRGRGRGYGRNVDNEDGSFEPGEGRRHFGRGFRGEGFQGHRMERMAEELGLTEEQKQQIEKIHKSAREDSKTLREKMRELREEMRKEWQASAPDEGAILDLHEDMHELKGELGELRIQTRLDVINVLTPEQREKMIENMKNRKGKGMGKGKWFGKGKNKDFQKGMKNKGRSKGYRFNKDRSPRRAAA